MSKDRKPLAKSTRDLIVLGVVLTAVFVFSYFFNVFSVLVELFRRNPKAVVFIDEIITGLVTLSIGLAVFAFRRWQELKKETSEREKLQEELVRAAETRAETERIINRQLQSEIELRKEAERSLNELKRKK